MATFEEAPPLPRSPTIVRGIAPLPPAPAPPSLPDELPRAHRDLPLPPRFPSMNDVTTVWTAPDAASPDPEPAEITDVAWKRPPPDLSPPSASANSLVDPSSTDDATNVGSSPKTPASASGDAATDVADAAEKKPSFVANIIAKIKGLIAKKKPAEAAEDVTKRPPVEDATAKKPALVKVKEAVCKMPDPTLVFVLEASAMLVLHIVRPALLRTWPARIIAPLLLVPTVAATALWRRTRVISLKPVPEYTSAAKPIPNAGKVVSMGESLRAREAALIKAEDDLRKGQMRLEVLRKEIEGRLPPQVSIANLLDRENEAARANVASPS